MFFFQNLFMISKFKYFFFLFFFLILFLISKFKYKFISDFRNLSQKLFLSSKFK